jgi:hypothetical protein
MSTHNCVQGEHASAFAAVRAHVCTNKIRRMIRHRSRSPFVAKSTNIRERFGEPHTLEHARTFVSAYSRACSYPYVVLKDIIYLNFATDYYLKFKSNCVIAHFTFINFAILNYWKGKF